MARSIAFGMALALALAACNPRASSGPAWPKSQDPETDGGESLAPRESAAVAAIEEADDEPADTDAKPAEKVEKTEAPAATPTPAAPTPTITVDEPPITEEIIIEIDE